MLRTKGEDMRRPRAIGYLRRDVSGIQQQWDETRIRALAERLGYVLLKTVAFGATTADPVARLAAVVRDPRIEAVVVPGLAHFGGRTPSELLAVTAVVTVFPERFYARGVDFGADGLL
ncbi:hypothetical protein [Nocardia sp. NPDC057353]|uniref:hypothetical protein n=1 Tax=Nocardia sp. NPDC057353 TaxID=3346104 RepID=UPI0036283024